MESLYVLKDYSNLQDAYTIQKETWPDDSDYNDLYDKTVFAKDDNCEFLIYDKDQLIGITGADVMHEYPNTIWFDWFTILPQYRRRGYGKKLNRFDVFRIETTYYEGRPALFLYDELMQLKEEYTREDTDTRKNNTLIYSYSLSGKLDLWNNRYLGLREYYDNLH